MGDCPKGHHDLPEKKGFQKVTYHFRNTLPHTGEKSLARTLATRADWSTWGGAGPPPPLHRTWEGMAAITGVHTAAFSFKTTFLSAASDYKFNESTCCLPAQLIHSDLLELKEISEKPLFFSNKLPVSALAWSVFDSCYITLILRTDDSGHI